MKEIEVVVVTGVCAPERHTQAVSLADATWAQLHTFPDLEHSPLHLGRACENAAQNALRRGAPLVLELPTLASLPQALHALSHPGMTIREVVCVVDAAHLLEDLRAEEFVPVQSHPAEDPIDVVARASLAVEQIEHSSLISCVNWQGRTTAELTLLTDLLHQLAPSATVRLHSPEHLAPGAAAGAAQSRAGSYAPSLYQAGWAAVLNEDVPTHPADSLVSGIRYQNLRPFHPARLHRVLDEQIDAGAYGQVIRSAGFCRLATRSHTTLQWDHVGRTIAFHIAQVDGELGWDEELLSVGQDLAFIGVQIDAQALRASLDAATLTDAELAAGPADWAECDDPFPAFDQAAERGE